MYQGISGTARTNVDALKEEKLLPITNSGPAHAGMGRLGGHL